eukprot:GEMP01058016.1.p1 GENE.GEMP01058016.1~~GEMP01058016.1.p1  ORF type:complete len:238 (+),score=54.52 GEMP01058016.1:145-858(+)
MAWEELRECWRGVATSLGIPESLSEEWWVHIEWWTTIEERHTEEWRHYHTLQHLQDLVHCTKEYEVGNRNFVMLATFFHDIVYNPQAPPGKNEDDSAELFDKFANTTQLDDSLRRNVTKVILQTKNHAQGDTLDANLFLDFDMAVLAWPWERYLKYTHQVREEYQHVAQPMWCLARSQFLGKSANTKIFHALTDLEPLAQSNIQREQALLAAEFDNFNFAVRWFTRGLYQLAKMIGK